MRRRRRKKRKKGIDFKTSQESSDDESFEYLSKEDEEHFMLIRGFKKYLMRKNMAKLKDHKKGNTKKSKEVIYNEYKKVMHIRNECPRLKF